MSTPPLASAAAAAATPPKKLLPNRFDMERNRVLAVERVMENRISHEDALIGARIRGRVEREILKARGYEEQSSEEEDAEKKPNVVLTKQEKLRQKRQRQRQQKKEQQQQQKPVPKTAAEDDKPKQEEDAPNSRDQDLYDVLMNEELLKLEKMERRKRNHARAVQYVEKMQEELGAQLPHHIEDELKASGVAPEKATKDQRASAMERVMESHVVKLNAMFKKYVGRTDDARRVLSKKERGRLEARQARLAQTLDFEKLSPEEQLRQLPTDLTTGVFSFADDARSRQYDEAKQLSLLKKKEEKDQADLAAMEKTEKTKELNRRIFESTLQNYWLQFMPNLADHVKRREARIPWFERLIRMNSLVWGGRAELMWNKGVPVRNTTTGRYIYDNGTQVRMKPNEPCALLISCPDEAFLFGATKWDASPSTYIEVSLEQLESFARDQTSSKILLDFFATGPGATAPASFLQELMSHMRAYDPAKGEFVFALNVHSIPLMHGLKSVFSPLVSPHNAFHCGVAHQDDWRVEHKDPVLLERLNQSTTRVYFCAELNCGAYCWAGKESQTEMRSCRECKGFVFCSPKCKNNHKIVEHPDTQTCEQRRREQKLLDKKLKRVKENALNDDHLLDQTFVREEHQKVVDTYERVEKHTKGREEEIAAVRAERQKRKTARAEARRKEMDARASGTFARIDNAPIEDAERNALKRNFRNFHGDDAAVEETWTAVPTMFSEGEEEDVPEKKEAEEEDRTHVVPIAFVNMPFFHVHETKQIGNLMEKSERINVCMKQVAKKGAHYIRTEGLKFKGCPFDSRESLVQTLALLEQDTPIQREQVEKRTHEIISLLRWLGCPRQLGEIEDLRAAAKQAQSASAAAPVEVKDKVEIEDELP